MSRIQPTKRSVTIELRLHGQKVGAISRILQTGCGWEWCNYGGYRYQVFSTTDGMHYLDLNVAR